MSKILLISHIFPPAIDGGSKVIYKLGQQLNKRGHQTLYLSSNCQSTDDFIKLKFKKIKKNKKYQQHLYLPVYHLLYYPLRLIQTISKKDSYFFNLIKVFQKGPIFKFFPFLKATIKIIKFKPQLIIVGPLPTTTILYAKFFQKIISLYSQKPKILINSSFHFTDKNFYSKPLIKTLKLADYLWTLTKYETAYFIKKLKIDPEKIILAGNGVDSSFLLKKNQNKKTTNKNKTNILFIGSFSAHKRIDLLINSFQKLLQKNQKVSNSIFLTIAGQKTLHYPLIEKTVNNLPPAIKKQINFNFNFSQNKLIKLIDNSTFLVLPSSQESFGLVLIEAWARVKPVIVSNIPTLSELVTKTKGGLIFEKDNSADLTNKIEKLINSPQSCQKYGQNGFAYVKTNYTWEIVVQKICQKIKIL